MFHVQSSPLNVYTGYISDFLVFFIFSYKQSNDTLTLARLNLPISLPYLISLLNPHKNLLRHNYYTVLFTLSLHAHPILQVISLPLHPLKARRGGTRSHWLSWSYKKRVSFRCCTIVGGKTQEILVTERTATRRTRRQR